VERFKIIQCFNSDLQVNILQYIWSSSPRSALKSTKAKIAQHIDKFEAEVKLLDRKTVRIQNIEMIKSLKPPLKTLDSGSASNTNADEDTHFPASAVAMYRNYTFVGREIDLEEMNKFLLP